MENCSTTWSLEESQHEDKKAVCLSGRGLKVLTRELIESSGLDWSEVKYLVADRNFISRLTVLPLYLETLSLSRNRISELGSVLSDGTFMSSFDELQQLQSLNLSSNCIVRLPNNLFAQCRSLIHIDLSHNLINDSLNPFEQAKSLQTLNLSYNRIASALSLSQFAGCNQLKSLDLSFNPATKLAGPLCRGVLMKILPSLQVIISNVSSSLTPQPADKTHNLIVENKIKDNSPRPNISKKQSLGNSCLPSQRNCHSGVQSKPTIFKVLIEQQFSDDPSSKENQQPLNQLISPRKQSTTKNERTIPLNKRDHNHSQQQETQPVLQSQVEVISQPESGPQKKGEQMSQINMQLQSSQKQQQLKIKILKEANTMDNTLAEQQEKMIKVFSSCQVSSNQEIINQCSILESDCTIQNNIQVSRNKYDLILLVLQKTGLLQDSKVEITLGKLLAQSPSFLSSAMKAQLAQQLIHEVSRKE